MTDTPMREAITESIPQEEVKTEVETPAQAVTPEPQETVKEPEQAKEEVEKFAEDVDLTGLTPEQLLETKKEWERKYTIKRQQEKAELKALQARLAELETQQPKPQEEKQEPASGELPTRDDVAQAFKEGRINRVEYQQWISAINQDEARRAAREEYEAIHAQELMQKEQEYQEQHLKDFESADPRLVENSPTADEALITDVRSRMADALEKYYDENGTTKGFDAKGLTTKFVQEYEQRIDEIVKTRTQQSVQAAKMRDAKLKKAEVRGSNAPSVSTSGSSLRSILEEAVIS